jgi:hypothetical protein
MPKLPIIVPSKNLTETFDIKAMMRLRMIFVYAWSLASGGKFAVDETADLLRFTIGG